MKNYHQSDRSERKYLVPEQTAEAIRNFVSAYLIPDCHMNGRQSGGYQVHSLYLDSPSLDLYRMTADRVRKRYKLRIRFYDTDADSPAFLEIRQCKSNRQRKYRAAVRKSAAEKLLRGEGLGTTDLLDGDENSLRSLAEFCDRQARMGARPTAFVSYIREAFVSPYAEAARVTFDRQIVGRHPDCQRGLSLPDSRVDVTTSHIVLEVKYSGGRPHWMKDIVKSFGLHRVPFPKYVRCVEALKLAQAMAG